MIECFAYAKINLFLDIEGIRNDGYHNIISVMQTVDWADRIILDKTVTRGVQLTCSNAFIPCDKSNTVYRAAELFLSELSYSGGIQLHIEKNIPSEAGLAGGSADAAATLSGLNTLFKHPFSDKEILTMGSHIGADVPFCLVGGTKIAKGIGDIIEPFPSMPSCVIVCAKIGEGVSTPLAYRALDEQYDFFKTESVKHDKLNCLKETFQKGSLERISEGLYNIFEETVQRSHPNVLLLKHTLLSFGADAAMMSGSGPSVFGIFKDETAADRAGASLRALGANCHVCKPISY